MIPMAVPNLSGNEREYLNHCIDTTFVSSVGEYVTKLEEMSASISGSCYGVATSSGTTGLDIALLSVGVRQGDLVIIPSYTFIATANAVAHCNAIPWLIDLNKNDWCIDIDLIERELKQHTQKLGDKVIHKETGRTVAAIMPVYVHGNIPDMNKLREIASDYNIPVIADAACAIGAKYKNLDLGSLAELSVFSFNGNKTVTAGGGGAVVGNSKELMDKVRHLTTTARVWPDYDFDEVGYNYRMTNIQAAVGVAQIERLDDFINTKQRVRKYYSTELEELRSKGITFFPTSEGSSCWLSGIVLPEATKLELAKEICSKLKEDGIEARTFWKPVHLQAPYKSSPRSDLAASEDLWQRIITLPCSTNIKEEELARVGSSLRDIINKAF